MMFGEFAPDQNTVDNPGLAMADGVLPAVEGFAPLPQFVAGTAGALGSQVFGGCSYKDEAGTSYTFVGTSANLYRMGYSGWTTVGSGFNASQLAPWRFTKFGLRVLATNGVDPVQKFDLGTDSAFSPLAGSPPTIGLLATVRDFIFAGVINGDAQTVQWSGINASEWWEPGYNQCDFQPIPDGGNITGICGGEYGLVLQETAINYFSYVGGNLIFQRDEVSPNIGCVHPNAYAQYGKQVFFLSYRGFFMFDGSQLTPIGDERVDRTFAAAVGTNGYKSMTCAVDPVRKIVMWTVPNGSVPTSCYIYSWTLNKWSTAPVTAETIWGGLTGDFSLEALDAYGTMDSLPASLDDDRWKGGQGALYVVNGSHTPGMLAGSPMAATFSMGDTEAVPGQWGRYIGCRPVVDAASGLTLTMNGKARQGDSATSSTYTALRASGEMPIRETWRIISPQLQIAAGTAWTHAKGLQFRASNGGRR